MLLNSQPQLNTTDSEAFFKKKKKDKYRNAISYLIKEHGVERHALFCAKLLQFAPKEVLNGFMGHVLTVGTNPALTSMSFGKVMLKKQFTTLKKKTE